MSSPFASSTLPSCSISSDAFGILCVRIDA
jgi:hypothetical protein